MEKSRREAAWLYHPSLQFDLALSGQGIRMLYPEGVREELSANLALTGTPEQAMLRGQVNVDQLSFTPDFDLSSITSFEKRGGRSRRRVDFPAIYS